MTTEEFAAVLRRDDLFINGGGSYEEIQEAATLAGRDRHYLIDLVIELQNKLRRAEYRPALSEDGDYL